MQLTWQCHSFAPKEHYNRVLHNSALQQMQYLSSEGGAPTNGFPPQPTCVVDCLKSKFLQQQDCILLINLTYLCTYLPTLKYFLLLSTLVRGG